MTNQRPIAIYNSQGEVKAYLAYPHLFNNQGEWIGWVLPNRDVYSVLGVYVGYLTNDPRIMRKRNQEQDKPRLNPPPRPLPIYPPATTPLAPLMAEVGFEMIDILGDLPDELHTLDTGELKEDLD